MTAMLVLGGVVGLILGYYVGRWRAEVGIAAHSARRAVKGRRDYRK